MIILAGEAKMQKISILINDIKTLSTFQIEGACPNIMNIKYDKFTLITSQQEKLKDFSAMIRLTIEMPTEVWSLPFNIVSSPSR